MAKTTLTAVTPVGTFTRKTDSGYKFVTVWNSPRARRTVDEAKAEGRDISGGVSGRWVKDAGFGVTWHFARPTPTKYGWDSAATLVGVFEVQE